MDALALAGPASIGLDGTGKLLFSNPPYQVLVQKIDSKLNGQVGEAAIITGKVLSRVLKGDGPVEDRQVFKNSNGVFAIRGRYWLLPGSNGRSQEIAALIFDESREVEALRTERQTQASFDDIARLTSNWVWEVDAAFSFTYVSPVLRNCWVFQPNSSSVKICSTWGDLTALKRPIKPNIPAQNRESLSPA